MSAYLVLLMLVADTHPSGGGNVQARGGHGALVSAADEHVVLEWVLETFGTRFADYCDCQVEVIAWVDGQPVMKTVGDLPALDGGQRQPLRRQYYLVTFEGRESHHLAVKALYLDPGGVDAPPTTWVVKVGADKGSAPKVELLESQGDIFIMSGKPL